MNINLNEKIAANFERLEALATEAAEDEDQSFSARASAMTATTAMLRELTKTQEKIINMERLLKLESVTIETVKEFLSPQQVEAFLQRLEETINDN